ncbi:MAG: hypothetical protein ABI318_11080 [Chthoniobacteraceae bacterium]
MNTGIWRNPTAAVPVCQSAFPSGTMPRVKTFQATILATAVVASCWAFYCSRSHRGAAIGRDTRNQTPPAEQARGQNVPASNDAAPITRTTGERQPALPPAHPGKVLAIPGLPRVQLEWTADLAWRKRIDAITSRPDLSDTLKAQTLMQILPGLPKQAIVEAAEEATTRLHDADYRIVMQPALLDPKTDNRVMAVLFADLMERPAAISLPILLSIAGDSRHSYAPFALQNLEQKLGQNLGSDWTKWEAAIQSHIAILRK